MRKVGTALGVLLILVWCLLPVAWIISLSFKSQTAITNGSPGFFPESGGSAGWQNYDDVLRQRAVPPGDLQLHRHQPHRHDCSR